MRVLAGDIGGTNARLAIIDVDSRTARVVHERRFRSTAFPGFAPIVRNFLAEFPEVPGRACFGIACPVTNGTCSATNLPWTLDSRSLAAEIGIPHARIINDLHAMGHAVEHLVPADLAPLQAGEPKERGAIAIIGAGTGLGEAFLTWDGGRYRVHDSEGGHANFGPRDEIEWGLFRDLAGRFGHVSQERVLSGPGLVSIYRYLATTGGAAEQAAVHAEMEHDDPAAGIGRRALDGSDPLAVRALGVFASAYGAQAGNLALTIRATGGVFIAGGIAPRIISKLRDGTFIAAFRDKGRLSDALARIPVQVIMNQDAGLIGAAVAALDG